MGGRDEERLEPKGEVGAPTGSAEEAVDREPLVLRPRPRLRRISRMAVALAAIAGMVVLLLLTTRYSRQSLSAAREARPPLAGPPPVGVDRIERFEPPEEPAVREELPPALPRPVVVLPPPRREPSPALRSALGSPLVAGSAARRGSPVDGQRGEIDLPSFEEFERRLRRPLAGDPSLAAVAASVSQVRPAPNLLPVPPTGDASAVERRPPPAGPHLAAGTFVPALVSHRLVSDQPGLIRAVVSRDVYDSASASRVLIPRGTRMLGRQGDLPSLGQTRLAVVWTRLVFPDGSSVDLAGDPWPSASRDGSLGLAGRVRQHWGRRYGAAVLLSLVGAGLQLSQPERANDVDRDAPGEIVAGQLGLELGRLSQEILRRYADLPPTISLQPGARVHAVLTRDLVFQDFR